MMLLVLAFQLVLQGNRMNIETKINLANDHINIVRCHTIKFTLVLCCTSQIMCDTLNTIISILC